MLLSPGPQQGLLVLYTTEHSVLIAEERMQDVNVDEGHKGSWSSSTIKPKRAHCHHFHLEHGKTRRVRSRRCRDNILSKTGSLWIVVVMPGDRVEVGQVPGRIIRRAKHIKTCICLNSAWSEDWWYLTIRGKGKGCTPRRYKWGPHAVKPDDLDLILGFT